ncbi:ferredoxin [Bacteroidia bacterium]|nr:ferredoxin [Bacteroidia bacterium]GHT48068.1 ferredoxin [Bacteroidia bacterium]
MKTNLLKVVRITLALFIFTVLTWAFVDFANKAPDWVQGFPHAQFIPAALAGTIGIVIIFVLLTLLFGRIYCSVICPMGILQDIISWFTRRGKKKNKKKRWYHYSKPYNIVRYSLLAICVVFLIFGISTPLLLLDPYSNFGRIAVNIFRPIVVEGNNLLNWVALQLNNYSFYQVTIHTITTASFVIALIALLIAGILSLLRGRLFCNTICPVGSLLGLISKFSLFRITIDESKCTKCGLCEKACKSECINSKESTVDLSRCVTCFNCLDRCNKQKAINYRLVSYKPVIAGLTRNPKTTVNHSRRSFIATSTAIAATAPLIPAWAQGNENIDVTKLTPITPPGSKSLKHFKEKCTACHLCITHCPMQVLKPAGFTFGLEYAFKPHLDYTVEHYCNYECVICSQICPNHAIEPLDKDTKKVTQIGIAQFERDRCVVYTDHTSCGACSEHCPSKAIQMDDFGDGLTIPNVHAELCIGCGGCESICPVRPVKAINILANAVHKTAERPPEEEIQEVDREELEFGF